MHSLDGVQRNIELIGKLFPNAITEVKRDGKVEHAIDFDVLRLHGRTRKRQCWRQMRPSRQRCVRW